jgi:hypothetical protein
MIHPSSNKRIAMPTKNRAVRKASDNVSIGSGSSYGSASSSRSESSSLSVASSLATVQGVATIRPRMSSVLPPPCHLNCTCSECTQPNSGFLDGLLNLAPPAPGLASAADSEEDPLSLLIGGMEDFSF